jgi:ABC-type branched-subunit amino acid transport system substrate-binding protein
MTERRAGARFILLLLALALVAAGCRADDDAAAPDEDDDTTVIDDDIIDDGDDDDVVTDDDDDDAEPPADGELATDVGVTEDACPDAVNPDNGCIYLGVMSDFTEGPFSAAGPLIQDAQEAFFRRVNENGGIGGYDVDVTTYVRDNLYQPETQAQVFEEIRNDILAIALSLGSSPTLAIIDDLEADNIVTTPGAWNSDFPFEEIIAESGANYCFEAMNAVDYFVENTDGETEGATVMGIHYPNDYGQDGSTGARLGAEANGMEFISVPTLPGTDNQAEAIGAIVSQQPDLVFLTLAPAETATIVGQAAAQGFQGRFIGQSPTWNVALLQTPAAPALEAMYLQAAPWSTFDSDTDGHTAMREALGEVQPNDFYTAGWVWSYPILRALEAAADNGDLTRAGVVQAFQSMDSVDYEGMLPEGSGNFAADPAERAVRATVFGQPSADSGTGVNEIEAFYTGPTAEGYEFNEPCIDLYQG